MIPKAATIYVFLLALFGIGSIAASLTGFWAWVFALFSIVTLGRALEYVSRSMSADQ